VQAEAVLLKKMCVLHPACHHFWARQQVARPPVKIAAISEAAHG
jgi:hypothetical protein